MPRRFPEEEPLREEMGVGGTAPLQEPMGGAMGGPAPTEPMPDPGMEPVTDPVEATTPADPVVSEMTTSIETALMDSPEAGREEKIDLAIKALQDMKTAEEDVMGGLGDDEGLDLEGLEEEEEEDDEDEE